jgi:hypothetical protein
MIVTVSLLFPRILVNLSLAFFETLSSSDVELFPPEEVKYCDTDPDEPEDDPLPLLPLPVSPPTRLLKYPVSYTEEPLDPRKELSRLLSPPDPVLLPLSRSPSPLLCELLV